MRFLRTVRAQLIAIYLVSVGIIGFSGAFLFYSRSAKVVEGEVAKNAYNTAIFTAYNVKYAVLLGDKSGVKDLVTQVMKDPDVVYAIVYDADGRPIAEMFRGVKGLYPIDELQNEGLETASRLLRDGEGRKILEITTPIVASRPADPEKFVNRELFGFSEGETILDDVSQSVRIGTVRIGMTFDNAKGRVKHILLSGTALFLAITFGGSILALLLFNKYFASPLKRMAHTAKRIAAGNLSRRVEEKGSWEIATFARAFNEMVEKVQNTIAELERLNDKLRREIDEKDDFLRAVSHDLSAPLRNVAGMVSLLQRRYGESLDQKASDWLARIVKNVNREMEMINDLLELSRIKTRRQPFTYVDLNEVIDQVIEELSFELEAKGGSVMIRNKLPTLYCERGRMKQLFQNLIDNAIKYSKTDEPPYIEIGYEEREEDHLFYVKDNGIGIKDEDKEKIFYVFRRARTSETARVDGKGVGLATVKRIVEVYGGEVWVESEYGKGSTFFISLPKSLRRIGDERQ